MWNYYRAEDYMYEMLQQHVVAGDNFFLWLWDHEDSIAKVVPEGLDSEITDQVDHEIKRVIQAYGLPVGIEEVKVSTFRKLRHSNSHDKPVICEEYAFIESNPVFHQRQSFTSWNVIQPDESFNVFDVLGKRTKFQYYEDGAIEEQKYEGSAFLLYAKSLQDREESDVSSEGTRVVENEGNSPSKPMTATIARDDQ